MKPLAESRRKQDTVRKERAVAEKGSFGAAALKELEGGGRDTPHRLLGFW